MRVRRFGRKNEILVEQIIIFIVCDEKSDAFEYDLPEYDLFLGSDICHWDFYYR